MSRRQDLRFIASYVNAPKTFPCGSVPIGYVARLMGKDACFVRAGIEGRWLPIGYCYKKPGSSKTSFYISPKLLWEVTGILYDPEEGA